MKFISVLSCVCFSFSAFAFQCEIKLAKVEEIVHFNDLWMQELQSGSCLLCERRGKEEGEPIEGDVLYFKIVNKESSLGYISCTLHGPERIVWVDNFFVEKSYRNRGIGKQALIQLETLLKERSGFDEIALVTTSENKEAFHLYSALGYEVFSTREQMGVTIYLMKKVL